MTVHRLSRADAGRIAVRAAPQSPGAGLLRVDAVHRDVELTPR